MSLFAVISTALSATASPRWRWTLHPPRRKRSRFTQDWLTHRYHAPSDDLDQPVDLASAGKYEDIIRQLMIKVANDPQRPQWKQTASSGVLRKRQKTKLVVEAVSRGFEIKKRATVYERPELAGRYSITSASNSSRRAGPACQQTREQWRLVITTQSRIPQRADEPACTGHQCRAAGDVPFMLRREREGGIGQTSRNQREFVGHRAHRADVEPAF